MLRHGAMVCDTVRDSRVTKREDAHAVRQPNIGSLEPSLQQLGRLPFNHRPFTLAGVPILRER